VQARYQLYTFHPKKAPAIHSRACRKVGLACPGSPLCGALRFPRTSPASATTLQASLRGVESACHRAGFASDLPARFCPPPRLPSRYRTWAPGGASQPDPPGGDRPHHAARHPLQRSEPLGNHARASWQGQPLIASGAPAETKPCESQPRFAAVLRAPAAAWPALLARHQGRIDPAPRAAAPIAAVSPPLSESPVHKPRRIIFSVRPLELQRTLSRSAAKVGPHIQTTHHRGPRSSLSRRPPCTGLTEPSAQGRPFAPAFRC